MNKTVRVPLPKPSHGQKSLLEEEWVGGVAVRAIAEHLNAMPGAVFETRQVSVYALHHHLYRPPGFNHKRAPATLSEARQTVWIREKPAPVVAPVVPREPVYVPFNRLRLWAAEYLKLAITENDLPKVNAACLKLGFRPFALMEGWQ